MKKFISFGSIGQFRDTIKSVQRIAQYEGLDENNEAIYNNLAIMPVVTAYGTEKIHGTNASVCYNNIDGFWVQSRNNIITLENDNAGCAFAAIQSQDIWISIVKYLAFQNKIDLDTHTIAVFFEWCGGNIQAKSAVTGLDKRAIIFKHFKVVPIYTDDEVPIWYETNGVCNEDAKIYNVCSFPTYSVEIDFNQPLLSQNEMIRIVEEIVEPASPLGKQFGQEENVGEGIVFTFLLNGVLQRFKVKGEKHANSKVTTLKPVDNEKEQSKIDFANYATNPLRLEQAWVNVFGINNEKQEPSIKATGDFLRAVVNDVMKEESDLLADMRLEPKEVNGAISTIARRWFQEQLDNYVCI